MKNTFRCLKRKEQFSEICCITWRFIFVSIHQGRLGETRPRGDEGTKTCPEEGGKFLFNVYEPIQGCGRSRPQERTL